LQYINGSVIGGGGVYIQADCGAGMVVIRHDRNATDRLAVSGGKGRELRRLGYTIVR
jgi:hypothetical protein